jgi:hypothetical protein
VFFIVCLTDQRRPESPLEALPALLYVSQIGEFERPMTGASQTIAVIITFRKCNKNPVKRRTGDDRSSSEKKKCMCKEEDF